jgi:hypothetical protein
MPAGTITLRQTSVTGAVTAGRALTYDELDSNFLFVQSGTGTLSRTAAAKMQDWVSVKDYGAVGDGVTNDTTAITAANNSTYTAIYLPHGTYITTLTTLAITKTYFGPGIISLNGTVFSTSAGWLKFNGATGGATTMPYLLSAYFGTRGQFYTGSEIVVSNKRVDATGTIQGVSAVADGSEPSMLSISADVNGPCIALEGYGTLSGGTSNKTSLAIYDLDAIIGGATSYSPGYGTKKMAISGKGDIYWGTNLADAPATNYRVKLSVVPNDTIEFTGNAGVSAQLKLTAGSAAEASLLMNGPASGQSEHVDFMKNGTVKWTLWASTAATPLLIIGTPTKNVVQFKTNGSVILSEAALATNVTAGFTYLPTCAGTPTGTPEAATGTVPMIVDTTGVKIWFYIGGAWKGVVVA